MSTNTSVISARKIRANRRNAQRSTGPRTDSGKARSSRNAIAHGLFCKSLVLPGEAPEYFRDFQCDMLKSLNPRDAMELSFAQQIISAAWRLKRVPAAEAKVFAMQQEQLHKEFLDEFKKREDALKVKLSAARYGERPAIQVELDQLKRQMQEKSSLQRSAGELLAMMLSQRESPASLALERLHRHEQRLAGTITRGLKHLRDLRERGSDAEPTELTCAMLIEVGDENVQNEPTDTDVEANSSSENELATDGALMNTDQIGDTGFQPARAALEMEESELLTGSSTG